MGKTWRSPTSPSALHGMSSMLWLPLRRGLPAPDMPSSSGAGTALKGSLLRDGLGLFSTVVAVPELDFGDPMT